MAVMATCRLRLLILLHVHLPVARRHLLPLLPLLLRRHGERTHAGLRECLEGQRQQQEAHEQEADGRFHRVILARTADVARPWKGRIRW